MMDHLHLVVERIDLNGGPRARLLAECPESLKGGQGGNLDSDVDRLRIRRGSRVEGVADTLGELGDGLIQRPDHWNETMRCRSSGTTGVSGRPTDGDS